MPADNDLNPVDRWLNQQVWPMAPPDGAFEQITKRARRRKMRHAAISGASGAVVAVAVAVTATLGLAGGLGTSGPGKFVIAASGSAATPSSTGTQKTLGTATNEPTASGSASSSALPTPAGSGSGTTLGPTSPGWLPDKFIPATVTWVGPTTGYVMGQAGTAGDVRRPGQLGHLHVDRDHPRFRPDLGGRERASHRCGERPGRRQPDAVPRRGERLGVRARTVGHARRRP